MGSSHIRVAFDPTLSSLALIKVGVLFLKQITVSRVLITVDRHIASLAVLESNGNSGPGKLVPIFCFALV